MEQGKRKNVACMSDITRQFHLSWSSVDSTIENNRWVQNCSKECVLILCDCFSADVKLFGDLDPCKRAVWRLSSTNFVPEKGKNVHGYTVHQRYQSFTVQLMHIHSLLKQLKL